MILFVVEFVNVGYMSSLKTLPGDHNSQAVVRIGLEGSPLQIYVLDHDVTIHVQHCATVIVRPSHSRSAVVVLVGNFIAIDRVHVHNNDRLDLWLMLGRTHSPSQ